MNTFSLLMSVIIVCAPKSVSDLCVSWGGPCGVPPPYNKRFRSPTQPLRRQMTRLGCEIRGTGCPILDLEKIRPLKPKKLDFSVE